MKYKDFQWLSIKTKVTLVILTFFLIGIWALAFYSSYTLQKDMERTLGEQQFSTVSILASNINEELATRIKALENVAALITTANMNNPKYLQKFLKERPVFGQLFNAAIVICDVNGIAIAEFPDTGRVGKNYKDRDYIIEALKGKSLISKPRVSMNLKAPVFSISAPILGNGKVIGVLSGGTDLSKPNFLSRITDNSYGKTGGYLLVSSKIRTIVYATDKNRIMEVLIGPNINPLINRYIQGYEGSGVIVNPVGVEVLSSAKGIPVANWYLVAMMPTKEAFAPVHAMQNRMLLAAIFLTLLAGVMTWWMLKRQLAPIFTTINTLATLADAGQSPQPLPITRQDEIGELIAGFNRLLGKVGERDEALKESEGNYRSLFQNASFGIFHSLPEGKFLRVNPALAQMLGYMSPEEMISAITDINTQIYVDSKKRSDLLSATTEKSGWVYAENRYRRKDGTTMTANLAVRKVLNADGIIAYLEGFVEDITERKQAQEKLMYIMKAVESSSDAVGISDALGHHIYQNKALSDLFGYTTAEELEAAGGGSVVVKNPAVAKEMFDNIMHGRSWGGELEMITKGGRVFSAFERADAIVDNEGNLIGLIGIITDITGHKQAEEERQKLQERLQRSEKMEAMGTLAGGVAHDLNNVLGILSGYSELLLEEIPEGSRSKGYVEKILQSTEKGAAIIQDLLTLARRGVAASDVINLNRIVSGFLKTPVFESLKDYHPRVTFKAECDNNLLNTKGSSIHLEKTLMNLVSNAAESISGEGEVTIRTENRYLDTPIRGYDEVKPGDYVVLTVSDTGMGIPIENREKIFEPFYTKKAMGRSGTGLGLAIVWGTVKDHSGYIDVKTEVGEGTAFTLYFPVTREEMTALPQQEPMERYMGQGESVLVVDDIAEQRDVASSLLTRLGYEVHAVAGGEEAVDYLKRKQADILVLDMIMAPGIDGLETYQRILEINPQQKAILVSGFSETERVKKAMNLGAGAYVKKPYVSEKIGVAIRDELARK